jgi:drug/metabolite transporter superfamily protein YnfA
MKLSKIYDVRDMNSYQFIAVTGVLMTLFAHLILWVTGKHVENFGALYACWGAVFFLGSIVNLTTEPGEEDHHHH